MSIESLIFEKGEPGRRAATMTAMDVPAESLESMIPKSMLRQEPAPLPEVSEIEIVRHYTHLSQRNFGVDTGFYPLGSCTMKYNPKLNEDMAAIPGFAHIHPLQPDSTIQGAIQLIYELEQYLSEISGMARVTLQPSAGAHGELTGLMLIKAYHESNGQGHRHLVLIPDNAHGTNPASATLADYKSVEVKTDPLTGGIDMEHLKAVLDSNAANVAAIMMTNPNTLGLFDSNILEIATMVHDVGGQLYYDGANANAVLGITRPGDMGFDVVHLSCLVRYLRREIMVIIGLIKDRTLLVKFAPIMATLACWCVPIHTFAPMAPMGFCMLRRAPFSMRTTSNTSWNLTMRSLIR